MGTVVRAVLLTLALPLPVFRFVRCIIDHPTLSQKGLNKFSLPVLSGRAIVASVVGHLDFSVTGCRAIDRDLEGVALKLTSTFARSRVQSSANRLIIWYEYIATYVLDQRWRSKAFCSVPPVCPGGWLAVQVW